MATFAMGTALGDYTASTLHLGYLASAFLFAGLILIPAIGYRWFRMNEVLAFWFAYVLTRRWARPSPTGWASRSTGAASVWVTVRSAWYSRC